MRWLVFLLFFTGCSLSYRTAYIYCSNRNQLQNCLNEQIGKGSVIINAEKKENGIYFVKFIEKE